MLDDRFDEPADHLIDEVAKSMTAAPPDASLAHRVSKRIADARERRTRWARPWVLVPVASACVVMLGVFVARENSGKVRLKPDATPAVTKIDDAPVVGRSFQPRLGGDPERVAPQTAGTPQRQTSRALAQVPPQTIEPIEVDHLDVQPLVEMDVIQISPIAIDRIEIAAMP